MYKQTSFSGLFFLALFQPNPTRRDHVPMAEFIGKIPNLYKSTGFCVKIYTLVQVFFVKYVTCYSLIFV